MQFGASFAGKICVDAGDGDRYGMGWFGTLWENLVSHDAKDGGSTDDEEETNRK